MKKKVLVIGASGFLGEKVLDELCEQCEIVAIRQKKLTVKDNRNIHWLCMDIAIDQRFRDIAFEEFDLVIHMATVFPTETRSRKNLFSINTGSALEILDRLIDKSTHNKTVYLFFSTISMFRGTKEQLIMSESLPCPKTEYDRSKLAAETCINSWENTVIIRIPLVLEAGATRSWVTRTYDALRNNDELLIKNGDAMYNHIIDFDCIMNLIQRLLADGCQLARRIKSPINLGSSEPLAIKEMVQLMKDITCSQSVIREVKALEGEEIVPIISTRDAESLGLRPKSTKEIVVKFAERSANG